MNFVIGLVLLYGIGARSGGCRTCIRQPRPSSAKPLVSQQTSAMASRSKCNGPGPAANAGIKPSDTVVKVGGTDVKTFDELVAAVRKGPAARRRSSCSAAKKARSANSPPSSTSSAAERWVKKDDTSPTAIGAIGVGRQPSSGQRPTTRCRRCPRRLPSPAICAVEIGKSLVKIPTKVGALVHSIGGGERDPETPISVVGASIIGGDTVDHGLWVAFWFFLAQLNFVLGAINLVPLLPFDGGHIAIAVYEKIRNMIPFGPPYGRREGAGGTTSS